MAGVVPPDHGPSPAPAFMSLDGRPRTPTLSLYCQGLNQSSSGTAKNAALIHLHLATGQIGRLGAGPFSLTGQPNAMGGREVGGLANLLSAHRDLGDSRHRAEVAALWGVPDVPSQPGRTAIEMFQAAADGEVKALWIVCTNPAQSLPDQATVRRALERAEFVIVQEAYTTAATCAYADLLLPATTWGEKDGTVTNSERCISRMRPAVPPPVHPEHPHDGPRDDWRIAVAVAQRLEAELRPGQPTLFDYPSAESVWNEHRESTRGRDLDITGLSYAMLDAQGPQQWPLHPGQTQGQARLYADGVFPTPNGRARFVAVPFQPVAEAPSARFPFSLTTGRLRDQWHGMSRTGTLGRLFGHVPEPTLQMAPQDMARRGFQDGELVQVSSPRGSLLVPLQTSDELNPGQVFMAMHWGSEVLGGRGADGQPLAGVNALTTSVLCPTSKQPEFKHAVVRVDKTALPWTLLGLAWLPEERAHAARQALVALMPDLAFATCVPFGRERTGLLFRAAHAQTPPEALIDRIEAALGLLTPQTLRYADARRGQRRAVQLGHTPGIPVTGAATLQAFLLAGDTRSEGWIKTLLQDELPAAALGQRLLMPSASAPGDLAGHRRSAQVCTCLNVNEEAITRQLAQSTGDDVQRLHALQTALKCGTQCGSCLPTLKKLVRATACSAAPAEVAS
jgi:assimilatory nitrate reductase catalytic subunit